MQQAVIDHAIVDVLVVDGDKCLLVEESKPGREGQFSMPGGHVEPHETLLEAAEREVREESGYDVELTGLIGIYQSVHATVNYSGPVFVASVKGGEAQTSPEHPSAKWVPLSELRVMSNQGKLWGSHIVHVAQTYEQGKVLPLDAVVCVKMNT